MYEFNDKAYQKAKKFKLTFEDFLAGKCEFSSIKKASDECDILLCVHSILSLRGHRDIDMNTYEKMDALLTPLIKASFKKPEHFVDIMTQVFNLNINDLQTFIPREKNYISYIAQNPSIILEILKLFEQTDTAISQYYRLDVLDTLLPPVNTEEIDSYSVAMQNQDNAQEIASIMSYRIQDYFLVYRDLVGSVQEESFNNMKKAFFKLLNYDEIELLGIKEGDSPEQLFNKARHFYLRALASAIKNSNNSTIKYIESESQLSTKEDLRIWLQKRELEKKVRRIESDPTSNSDTAADSVKSKHKI